MQTFIISWRNPTKAQREWGLSTYIEALKEAVDVVLAITGSKDLNMLGACSGGITCTALLGHYAALGEKKVNAMTLLVSVLDTTLDTEVALFVDEQTLKPPSAIPIRRACWKVVTWPRFLPGCALTT